jgi:lysozyme family protein
VSTFDIALKFVLDREGGYSDDPRDPGGRTNLGVTQRELDSFNSRHPEAGLPSDVKDLTADTVAPLYRADYWETIQGESLPSPTAILAFDCSVNQGPGRSRQLLGQTQDPIRFAQARLEHYLADANWSVYGKGWTRRLFAAVSLALSSTGKGE